MIFEEKYFLQPTDAVPLIEFNGKIKVRTQKM